MHLHRRDFLTVMLTTFAAPMLAASQIPKTPASVPTLEELAGEWMDAATLRSRPALNSACGSGQAAANLLAVENLSFPPLTQAGTVGHLRLNGQDVDAQQYRWSAFQATRRAHVQNLHLETAVRLPYHHPGLLLQIQVANPGPQDARFTLEVDLSAVFAAHPSWGWHIPRTEHLVAGKAASAVRCAHPLGHAVVQGDVPRAFWETILAPGHSCTLALVLAVADTKAQAGRQADADAQDFARTWEQVRADWQARFEAMFRPNNPVFSGHLPTLMTDDLPIRRAYYMSALSLLCVCRTCFPLAPRVYVTNTPEANCTMMYFWDTREAATVLALLDPVMLRTYLYGWLERGITQGYAEEFLTGTLQGPRYSANDFSVFLLLDTYLNVTGDRAFLAETLQGRTVQQHMTAIATHWKSLVRPGRTLADYGEADNLLECVPTYIHEVPSFNAANVWMMRRAAALAHAIGDHAQSADLRADAARLLPAVLDLYVPGEGVWVSLHRDGSRVPMRHVLDFITIGQTLTADLTPSMRAEMVAFVERELLVRHWMRAQSWRDPAAADSDRPDHGPKGAFTAWPAETIATFCAFGHFSSACDFLRRCAAVTAEGPFSQSRELLDDTPDPLVRIASRGDQTYNAECSAAFAETVLTRLFGFRPDFLTHTLVSDTRPRSLSGSLFHVRCGDADYRIHSDPAGLQCHPET